MTFKEALRSKDFVVTAQMRLADVFDGETLIAQGKTLHRCTDALQLTDGKWPQISGVAAAALLIPQGINPIMHMNTRDRNRIAMQKDLYGAAALGVGAVLVTRGVQSPHGVKSGIRNVYDTPALDFMAYIHELKEQHESPLPADFLIGAHAELFQPGPDWTPKTLIRKCDAGAQFVQLQICFDIDATRNYMSRIVAAKLIHRASFLAALSPLPSADAAQWVRENVKGALVPDWVVQRLEKAPDPPAEGVRICAELMQELTTIPGIAGVNLVPLGEIESIPAAVDAADLPNSKNVRNRTTT